MMVRKAAPEDVPQLARIYLQALRDTYRELLPEEYFASLSQEKGEAVWARALAQPGQEVWVADLDGQAAGVTGCKPDPDHQGWLNLSSLYVDGACQGRGVGRTLIHTVWERARAMGCDGVSVCVVRDNPRARGLYEGLGARFLRPYVYKFDRWPVDCHCYVWPLEEVCP